MEVPSHQYSGPAPGTQVQPHRAPSAAPCQCGWGSLATGPGLYRGAQELLLTRPFFTALLPARGLGFSKQVHLGTFFPWDPSSLCLYSLSLSLSLCLSLSVSLCVSLISASISRCLCVSLSASVSHCLYLSHTRTYTELENIVSVVSLNHTSCPLHPGCSGPLQPTAEPPP